MPRFSHHRSPVLNHVDPVNPRHGLRCTADASPFAIMAGREALCCNHLNSAYSQVYASMTPTVVAREAPRGGVRLVFCERGYTSSGYCFLQLPAKDELVPALIRVLSAGQYPLHHSICLPSPQGQRSPQCPCSVRKRFSRNHCCRGRLKPDCQIVGSHTR